MSSKRKRRKPEQVIRCLAEGESMLAAGKPAARCRKASLGSGKLRWGQTWFSVFSRMSIHPQCKPNVADS